MLRPQICTLLCRRIVNFSPENTLLARRRLTTSDVVPSKVSSPKVVSRRAWNALKENIPPRPPPAAKPKAEDKPWPQSVRIAGYVAGGVLVPYFALWTITSNPTLRRWIGPYLPMDRLRSHFGHIEPDAQSYVEEMQLDDEDYVATSDVKVEKPSHSDQYYQFPNEPTLRERQQQEIIDAMNEATIRTKITVFSSSSSQDSIVQSIPAKTLATVESVIAAIQQGTTSFKNGGTNPLIALDFEEDDDSNNDSSANSVSSNTLLSDDDTAAASMVSFDVTANNGNQDPAKSLLKETQTFSKWFYISPQQQQQRQESNDSSSSDRDLAISRLEFTIAELQKNLKDPTSTRDMDEMAAELKQAKRELSGLKWKRLLGW